MIYDKIKQDLAGRYTDAQDNFGMLVLELSVDRILDVVQRLKADFAFDLLLDITAVDYPERELRFNLVYHLYSSKHNCRIRLKSAVAETEENVPTLVSLYGSARYLEREAHEMFGIRFAGNDDLRPILLYEGFVGHPLRKDYPIDQEQPLVEYRK